MGSSADSLISVGREESERKRNRKRREGEGKHFKYLCWGKRKTESRVNGINQLCVWPQRKEKRGNRPKKSCKERKDYEKNI